MEPPLGVRPTLDDRGSVLARGERSLLGGRTLGLCRGLSQFDGEVCSVRLSCLPPTGDWTGEYIRRSCDTGVPGGAEESLADRGGGVAGGSISAAAFSALAGDVVTLRRRGDGVAGCWSRRGGPFADGGVTELTCCDSGVTRGTGDPIASI